MDDLTAQIYELAGETFNLSSPKQLAHILFEVLELPAKKKNQRGYSTATKCSSADKCASSLSSICE